MAAMVSVSFPAPTAAISASRSVEVWLTADHAACRALTTQPLLGNVHGQALVGYCATWTVEAPLTDPLHATRFTLRSLARQHLALHAQLAELHHHLDVLTAQANPALRGVLGVGVDVAATLLVVAGDNPQRLRSPGALAALCGASPVEASSGKTTRHRLNRGGNRDGNHALWRIVFVRLTCHPETRAYVARRTAEGRSSKEIIRCLKRYLTRELYPLLTDPPSVPHGPDLRAARTGSKITLATVAEVFSTHQIRISRLERGLDFNTDLAIRYQTWLSSQTS